MKRLTTDNPKDNIENALNLFYIKDRETWVRGGGPGPECADVSLFDFVRDVVKTHIPNVELPKDDDNLSMMMDEWLFDGPDTAEGVVALLYAAAWAFAELRERLKKYEDSEQEGLLVTLPRKVGTDFYDVRRFYRRSKVVNEELVKMTIDHYTIGQAGIPIAVACNGENEWGDYEPHQLLSSEEAKAELNKDG